ncbi:Major Facilitator Superfamily [Novymonas esmeraldas]|uniref:Lysosomal dipeptide transporter MFSD1 n=1 Tax=Novymonas esmeraldas TaxID=1808958 RepID=A0AAW0EV55_9TRYP
MSSPEYGDVVADDAPVSVWAILREESHELRWYVLAVACFLTFGSYYIYDFPGSIGSGSGNTIENYFTEHGMAYTESMNQYLYSVYAWPNTVLSVAGGLLIDKYIGLRRAMLLFTTLIFAGSVLFFTGVHARVYWVLIAGRIVFGLGGESLSVAQSAFVARWFKGRRGMALAFGITISFSRVGSSFNFLFAPAIANSRGIEAAVASGIAACGVSVLACCALVLADRYAERTGYLAITVEEERRDADAAVAEGDSMRLADVVQMPLSYWLLCVVCVFCYTAIFPFMGVGKNFFEVKYGYSGDTASRYLSFYQITSAVTSPVIGLAVDSVGRNTWWLILACVSFAGVHLLFMTTMIPGAALMVLMGCFYSFLVSGLWPSVPWAVSDSVVGVAYGAMTSVQNIGLASFPMLVGAILDHFRHHDARTGELTQELPPLVAYMWTEALFLLSALLALLASVVLLSEDIRNGGVLSAASSKRQQILEELRRQQNDYDGVVPDLEDMEYEEESGPQPDAESLSGAALVDALPTPPPSRSRSEK